MITNEQKQQLKTVCIKYRKGYLADDEAEKLFHDILGYRVTLLEGWNLAEMPD